MASMLSPWRRSIQLLMPVCTLVAIQSGLKMNEREEGVGEKGWGTQARFTNRRFDRDEAIGSSRSRRSSRCDFLIFFSPLLSFRSRGVIVIARR